MGSVPNQGRKVPEIIVFRDIPPNRPCMGCNGVAVGKLSVIGIMYNTCNTQACNDSIIAKRRRMLT